MLKNDTRRNRCKTTALATAAAIAARSCHGAHAAGKLSIMFWDHWVPGANNTSKRSSTSGRPRRRSRSRSTTSPRKASRTCSPSPPKRRRGPATTSWRCRPGSRRTTPTARAARRRHGPLIKQNGDVNATVEYLGQAERPLDRGAGLDRQPDQGAVLAHRSDEAACRHRHSGDVSGRRARRRPTAGHSNAS